MLTIGTKAPDFTLPDKDGNLVSLHDFLGQKVIVYFYPKDNTPGCTTQACGFRDNYPAFLEKGVKIIGISKDTEKAHTNFTTKYNLPFTLLSDPTHAVIEQYGAWAEKKLYGKIGLGIVRTTYLIDEQGIVINAKGKVKASESAAETLSWLE